MAPERLGEERSVVVSGPPTSLFDSVLLSPVPCGPLPLLVALFCGPFSLSARMACVSSQEGVFGTSGNRQMTVPTPTPDSG
jgi:hypothetical protein